MAGKEAGNGVPPVRTEEPQAPRRLVLLNGEPHGEAERVLIEYQSSAVIGRQVHEDVQRYAEKHRGHYVAVEWRGPLGWTRYLWCRKE